MASPSGVFYAYVKWRDADHWRYLLTFTSRDIADQWWRKVSSSPGYTSIKRASAQFYYNDGPDRDIQILSKSVKPGGCAESLENLIMITHVTNQTGTFHWSAAPSLPCTERQSGGRCFIRSVIQPSLFWYYDSRAKVVKASSKRRSTFTVRIANPDGEYRDPVIMIGSDKVLITTGANDATELRIDNSEGLNILGSGTKGGPALAGEKARDCSDDEGTQFLFSDFTTGFAIGYGIEWDAEGLGDPIVKSDTDSEGWELVR